MALMGGKANSAGRTVVLSSFLLGGPSGSGVATTVTIGAVAYPMMKQSGFEKNAAGGLLAAGGLGAILSPPVLGAAAFLIAEFLKISYLDVIWMATIPTCLYYLSLLFMVELDAKRFGADAVRYEQPMSLCAITRRYGFHFTSLIAVIVFMVAGYSPMLAVFYSTLMCFLLSALTPETALGPRRLLLPLLVLSGVILAPALINVLVSIVNALVRVELPALALGGLTDVVIVYLPAFLLVLIGVLAALGLTNFGREETLHTKKLARTLVRRFDRGAQRRDHLRLRRHHRRRGHAHRARIEVLVDRARLCGRQSAAHRDLYRAGGLDRRPRRAGHGVLHHLRGDRGAGADQARRARLRRAYVHLLLRGAVGGFAADRAVAVRRRGDHRRRPLRDHAAGVEVHAAGVPGAVRLRPRSAGHGPADEDPKDGRPGTSC